MTDWGQAGLIGGVGFATVMAVLLILAAVVWLTGWVIKRTQKSVQEPQEK